MKKIDINFHYFNLENEKKPKIPVYSSTGASGADLCAFIENKIVLKPGERKLIPTGLVIEIPDGFEAQVRPRSGLALKQGITCLNSPGTIDSDYRGEIGIILINLSENSFTINDGDRIAQLVIAPVVQANFFFSEEISSTKRDSGGFGSTGIKSN